MQQTQTSPPIRNALTYHTMTVGGIYGSDIAACTEQQAIQAAGHLGYKVLDVMEDPAEGLLLIVAE